MNKKGNSAFYLGNDIKEDDICYEDYLIKSPPASKFGTQSSWKKRYFILAKSKEEHVLSYFKNKEVSRKSLPLGEIRIRNITELCIRPDYHSKWNTLQKLLKCSSENVMLVKTEEREYFFIGEAKSLELLHQVIASLRQMSESQIQNNSCELVNTNLNQQSQFTPPNEADEIYVSIREVLQQEQAHKQQRATSNPEPFVEYTFTDDSKSYYDVPRSLLLRLSQPTPEPANKEKLRSYSLPTPQLPAHYDVPRKVIAANWRSKKGESADSGIYESMATIKACHDSVSSIDSLGSSDHIHESSFLNLKTANDMFPDGFLDENCLQSPLKESNKGRQLAKEDLETLLSKITEETKLLKLNIAVCQQDFKTNLSLLEVQDKVCVTYSDEKCAFKPGDQIVAINKLQIRNVGELRMLLNRSMEEEVLATILRMPDSPSAHNENMEKLRKEIIKVVQRGNLHKEPPTSQSP
ncbi:pleckstrin homology domain-containing family S member 1-like isoform X1 [Hypanus sabinus]|uniref:pleckstrin homology domain-containing family S member 1-like isoform X1 n=1 Tax=Hypanus sabinus TaxID=79690 RepID=UPI0028C4AB8A|nr:pleckstrin homology domain-containing family S member 1-like isoform X1 [Hypanus sabinus]XP_059803873.1 pleckstrin homology domain-containing family S member 1-like isoform X1 [Hypanus sabinus]